MRRIFTFVLAFIILGTATAVPESAKAKIRIVILGDSLTEGYGVPKASAFPALVEQKLIKTGHNVEVINAGVSGSTTSSGLSRLRWQLKSKPQIVVIALGANDMLRGIDLNQSEKNLDAILALARDKNLKVLLVGMRAPPNYGSEYGQHFVSMYARLAKKYNVALLPFLLEGVAGVSALNQSDRMHPNEGGHAIVADTVTRSLLPLL